MPTNAPQTLMLYVAFAQGITNLNRVKKKTRITPTTNVRIAKQPVYHPLVMHLFGQNAPLT